MLEHEAENVKNWQVKPEEEGIQKIDRINKQIHSMERRVLILLVVSMVSVILSFGR